MAGDPPVLAHGGVSHARDTHQSLLGHSRRSWLHNAWLERVPIASLHGQVTAIYFAASWSLPCRAFTPLLARVNAELEEQRAFRPFCVVHVGFEQDKHGKKSAPPHQPESDTLIPAEGSAESAVAPPRYMSFGLRLPAEDRHTRRRLVQRFGLTSIPALVFLSPSGAVSCVHGVALLHARGAHGYPFSSRADGPSTGVLEGGERRRFEQEVVLLFAHVDRRQRLLIDVHDLEVCLAAGGQLPLAAIRPYAAQMLHDIASPSLGTVSDAAAAAAVSASLSPGSSSDSAVAYVRARFASRVSGSGVSVSSIVGGGLSVSLAEWKAFFARAAASHGAEFPLAGLRQMLAFPDQALEAVEAAPEAAFDVLRADVALQQRQHSPPYSAASELPRLSQPRSARAAASTPASPAMKQLRFGRAVAASPVAGRGTMALAPLSAR